MHEVGTDGDEAASMNRWMTIAGSFLSCLVTLFLVMDAGVKIACLPIVGQTMVPMGWSGDAGFWFWMGLLLLGCTILYAIPRTALLGAILLTGYLGGAIGAHVRIGNPLFSHTLFGVYLGVMLWGGLWLRWPKFRALLGI